VISVSAADVEWIAVDWGTSNLRVWAMAGPTALDTREASFGMGKLARDAFEPALLGLIEPWLRTDGSTEIVICGMAGARQGWAEAPYASVPGVPLQPLAFRQIETKDARLSVTIIHGLSQADPPDVMRGEETQIAGFISQVPDFAGVLCLPGTHTKWASLQAGRVALFRTFMTGELFSILRAHSILRHSVADAVIETTAETMSAFEEGLAAAAADPDALTSHLFTLRAAGILSARPAEASLEHLSGLLIGSETTAMRSQIDHHPVVILGTGTLAALYAHALQRLDIPVETRSAEAATLLGLTEARTHIMNQRPR
jgi:2-dehydro-3-deoxygalactonokinase